MELKNWHLLEMMAKHYGVYINPKAPRESRLAVAYELDKCGKVPEAIEAMTAVPISEQAPMYLLTLDINREKIDPQTFYEDFPPIDD